MPRRKNFQQRLGMLGYVRLLACLNKPTTRSHLVASGEAGRTAACRFLKACHARGHIHIFGWEILPRCLPKPIYRYGPGTDAPYPTHRPNGKPVNSSPIERSPAPIFPELRAFLDLLDALADSPLTHEELVEETGVSIMCVRKVVKALRCGDSRMARIATWRPSRSLYGRPVAAFSLGTAKDAKKPIKSRAQINRDYLARKEASLLEKSWRGLCSNASVFNQRA